MKDTFCMAVGALGAAIASLYGGWDAALQTLILFMAVPLLVYVDHRLLRTKFLPLFVQRRCLARSRKV